MRMWPASTNELYGTCFGICCITMASSTDSVFPSCDLIYSTWTCVLSYSINLQSVHKMVSTRHSDNADQLIEIKLIKIRQMDPRSGTHCFHHPETQRSKQLNRAMTNYLWLYFVLMFYFPFVHSIHHIVFHIRYFFVYALCCVCTVASCWTDATGAFLETPKLNTEMVL